MANLFAVPRSIIVHFENPPESCEEGSLQDEEILESRVRSDLIKSLITLQPSTSLGSTAAATGLIGMLYGSVPTVSLIAWYLLNIVVCNWIILKLYFDYKAVKRPHEDFHYWEKRSFYRALISGGIWGSSALIFYKADDVVVQLIIIAFVLTLSAAGTSTFVAYRKGCYAFVLAMSVPVALRSLVEFNFFNFFVFFSILMSAYMMLLMNSKNHKAFSDSLKLQYLNMHLNENLKKEKDRATEANEKKSQFLAAASHDLRQPLHAQSYFLKALEMSKNEAEREETISMLNHSVNIMTEMFDKLLDLSRLDAGIFHPNKEPLNIGDVLEELHLEYEQYYAAEQVKFSVVACNVVVNTDKSLLMRMLRNILTNAFVHSGCQRIVLGCRRKGDCLSVEVWDNGKGIDEDKLEKVFNEYYQIGNPHRDRNKGLGLGLSIVKKTAELLNCNICLGSKKDIGTVLSIEVPLGEITSTIKSGSREFPDTMTSLKDLKVLLIDDDELIIDAMVRILRVWGCVVVTATSTEGILEVAEAFQPEVIISDYRLPGKLNGSEVISKIMSQVSEVVLGIIMTGDTVALPPEKAGSSEYAVLYKPISPEKLNALMKRMLTLKVRVDG